MAIYRQNTGETSLNSKMVRGPYHELTSSTLGDVFFALAESLNELVFVWKTTGEMLWVNSAFVRETGLTVQDFGFRNTDNPFIHPDDLPHVNEAIGAFMASPESQSPAIANRFLDAWGREHALATVLSKVTWEGEPALLLVSSSSETSEKPVAVTRNIQRQLMEAITDGVLEVDTHGSIQFSNRTFQGWVDLHPVELARHSLESFFAPESRPVVSRALSELRESSSEARCEALLAGTALVLDLQFTRINSGNVPAMALVIARDISSVKHAEQIARNSEDRFRQLFDGAADAIFVFDAQLVLADVNRVACERLGYSKEYLIGRSLREIDETTTSINLELLREQFRRHGGATLEGVHARADGSRFPVEVRVTPFEYLGARHFFAAARDITDRKRAEAEKLRLEAALRHAQKLESIGRLAGGVAHDFNNMLTAICGNVTLALSALQQDDPSRELLAEIEKVAQSAATVTRQLLTFSRKQIVEPKLLDLNQVIRQLENMLQRLLGEDITLQTKLAPKLPSIRFDRGQLDQVIVNLCVNARDAMPEGGHLLLETSLQNVDGNTRASPNGVDPGNYIVLTVLDTGVGMGDEIKSHLFEPFFTTKPSGQGTGLGLAMVYGALNQAGGAVLVESEPKRGTTFTLYFAAVNQPPDASRPAPKHDLPRGSESIVVVEDEDSVREFAERLLTRLGYTVRSYPSGNKAVSELEENCDAKFDLLITDVVMPGMNGRELANQLRRTRPRLEVLFTSGYTEDVIAHHGVLEAGIEFIGKPYTVAELANRVRTLLDNKRQREPLV